MLFDVKAYLFRTFFIKIRLRECKSNERNIPPSWWITFRKVKISNWFVVKTDRLRLEKTDHLAQLGGDWFFSVD
jgi:hypothetical protein